MPGSLKVIFRLPVFLLLFYELFDKRITGANLDSFSLISSANMVIIGDTSIKGFAHLLRGMLIEEGVG